MGGRERDQAKTSILGAVVIFPCVQDISQDRIRPLVNVIVCHELRGREREKERGKEGKGEGEGPEEGEGEGEGREGGRGRGREKENQAICQYHRLASHWSRPTRI